MRNLIPKIAAIALLITLSPSVFAQTPPRYTVTDLGTLGGESSVAEGVNDKGQVVGWADTGGTVAGTGGGETVVHAFLWDKRGMQDLDLLASFESPPGMEAHSINNQGDVAGGIAPRMGLMHEVGWLWRNGKMQTVGGDALAINNSGQALIADGNWRSVIWRNGRMQEVPLVPGFHSTAATTLNNHGDVAGYCENGPNDVQGFVRLHGKVSLLGTLPGQNTSRAVAVNDAGQVVGMSGNEFYSQTKNADGGMTTTSGTRSLRAFFWQEGRLTDLGEREVAALGNQGQVIGSYFQYGPARTTVALKAFLWQNGRFTDLDLLIDKGSGWKLEDARAINSHGQIVGVGSHDGAEHAFLLTPIHE